MIYDKNSLLRSVFLVNSTMLQSYLRDFSKDLSLTRTPISLETQALVIGAGPAGRNAFRRLRACGLDPVIADSLGILGGSNLVAGAVASKAFWEYIRKRCSKISTLNPEHLSYEQGKETFKEAKKYVSEVIEREGRENKSDINEHFIHGYASFLSDGTIKLRGVENDYIVSAKNVVIATGSRPRELSSLPFTDHKILSSNNIFMLNELPEHITIVGAGIVGIEYACYFRALGSDVTLINRSDGILTASDDMVSSLIREELVKLGVNIIQNCNVIASSITESGQVTLKLDNTDEELSCDAVLVSAGRIPNTDKLDAGDIPGLFEFIGSIDSRIPRTFETEQHTFSVSTAGDSRKNSGVVGQALNHGWDVAGRITGVNSSNEYSLHLDEIPTAIFAFPPAAYVGLTQAELDKSSIPYIVGEAHYQSNCLSNLSGDETGQIRVYFSKDDHRILGAHIVGEIAYEIVNLALLSMKNPDMINKLSNSQFTYPSRSRLLCQAARDAQMKIERASHC